MNETSSSGSSAGPLADDDEESQKRKVAVTCIECGNAYAAEKWPNGKILLIGKREGCQCGADEFDIVTEQEGDSGAPRTKHN
ncbi:hypothetical protein ACLI4Z_01990 [Natrialbaceae archaeon A-arb3/5]